MACVEGFENGLMSTLNGFDPIWTFDLRTTCSPKYKVSVEDWN
jgi:hypothetical protein